VQDVNIQNIINHEDAAAADWLAPEMISVQELLLSSGKTSFTKWLKNEGISGNFLNYMYFESNSTNLVIFLRQ
jgi:hypothetical protein